MINCTNLKISQLKRKIENEFEELYPREPPLQIQTIEDNIRKAAERYVPCRRCAEAR